MRMNGLGSRVTDSGAGWSPAFCAPYSVAGIFPAARRRRASFLPLVVRLTASRLDSITDLSSGFGLPTPFTELRTGHRAVRPSGHQTNSDETEVSSWMLRIA